MFPTIPPRAPDSGRRRLLRDAGATLGLAALAAGAPAATAKPAIARYRYGIATDTPLPLPDTTYVLPLATVDWADGTDCTLQADNTVLINTAGLYRVCVSCDWPGQYGVDVDLRTYGSRLRPAAKGRLRGVAPDALTAIDDTDTFLATVDVPGSDPPQMVRWQGPWTPGFLALGAIASLDVALPTPGLVGIGDLAFAAHTAIADATIGAPATAALIVTAKAIAADKVRVSIYNPSVAAGVAVPAGTLNVVAMSATQTRGESADAWMVLQSTTEPLAAGDVVYGIFRSKTTGDFLQVSDSSFLQVERWA